MLLLQQRSPYGLLRNVFVQRSERAHQPLAEQLPSLPEGAYPGHVAGRTTNTEDMYTHLCAVIFGHHLRSDCHPHQNNAAVSDHAQNWSRRALTPTLVEVRPPMSAQTRSWTTTVGCKPSNVLQWMVQVTLTVSLLVFVNSNFGGRLM